MKSLSEILNLSRTNRPDEWSMDDFSRMASVLEKRIAELEEKLFTQSQESKDAVERAIEIILEKDDCIAELEKVISLDVKLKELAVKKRIAGNKKQWEESK
jgi:uncharacterized protein with HEPN domain